MYSQAENLSNNILPGPCGRNAWRSEPYLKQPPTGKSDASTGLRPPARRNIGKSTKTRKRVCTTEGRISKLVPELPLNLLNYTILNDLAWRANRRYRLAVEPAHNGGSLRKKEKKNEKRGRRWTVSSTASRRLETSRRAEFFYFMRCLLKKHWLWCTKPVEG